MARSGLQFSEQFTAGPGDATQATIDALRSGILQVVAVGGDGTLNEVLNGYLDPEGRPLNPDARLAILPAGTGSDFRKSLYQSEPGAHGQHRFDCTQKAILAITSDQTRPVDAGLVTCHDQQGAPVTRFFMNVVTFGLGGDVSRLVNGWRGRLPTWIGGRIRFASAAVRALAYYKTNPVAIQADNSQVNVESNLIVVANGRFAGGGMMLAPAALIDDGLFDIIITNRASRLDVVRELPRIRRGGYLDNPKVDMLRAAEVSLVTSRPVPLDIDGESGNYAPARFRLLPSVIRFAAL